MDLFSDENISINSSIQNSKDISKIFTDFSQSFTIPASKNNNKVLKHYYNTTIAEGSSIDARKKLDGLIELNHATFKKGKVRIDGVKMKDNSPEVYKITFFGNTITLPELFAEDKLSDVGTLSAYDHPYDASQVETGFHSSLVNGSIVYPLISHTKRLYYDGAGITTDDGNLYYDATKPNRGLDYRDLKPALKVKNIIDAIGTQYGLTFQSDFFDSAMFNELYMWLHRSKGQMTAAAGTIQISNVSNFVFDSGTDFIEFRENGSIIILETFDFGYESKDYQATLSVTPIGSGEYTVSVYNRNNLLDTVSGQTGSFSKQYNFDGNSIWEISVVIETSGGITDYDAQWSIEEFIVTNDPYQSGFLSQSGVYRSEDQSIISQVIITDNIPNIGVMEFMSNLFKMFNLTTYVLTNGHIYVETLDQFYSEGSPIDITLYVDRNNNDIDRAIPYKKINLEFPESKTFFSQKFNEINGGINFGSLLYDGGDKYDGGDYSVKVEFEKIIYERITNTANNSLTDIGWGWFVDYKGSNAADIEKVSSIIEKPLLFFNVLEDSSATPISWISGTHSQITTYNRPSNINEDQSQSLNFGAEIDEYNRSGNSAIISTNSLFNNFYKTYIEQVFDRRARVYKYSAKLPSKVLLNYNLNDTFLVFDQEYIINNIGINLITGESKLELINKLF
tara:strand:- start:681 stop:2711 length:2031 start_codon:yes stop_codon:yes gene_type:complete